MGRVYCHKEKGSRAEQQNISRFLLVVCGVGGKMWSFGEFLALIVLLFGQLRLTLCAFCPGKGRNHDLYFMYTTAVTRVRQKGSKTVCVRESVLFLVLNQFPWPLSLAS